MGVAWFGPMRMYCPVKAAGRLPVTRRLVMIVSSATGSLLADRDTCLGPLGMVTASA